MKDQNFDPKAFLGAKIVSPLEQEKLVGGIGELVDNVVTVSTVVTISIVVDED
jgi:hypothetical protein